MRKNRVKNPEMIFKILAIILKNVKFFQNYLGISNFSGDILENPQPPLR